MDFHIIKDYIGLYTPTILLFLTIFFLRNQLKYMYFFVFGFILNFILNILLKLAIKEPRPSDDRKNIEIGIVNGVRVGFDKYGMPSGHAQICGYCLSFVLLTLNSPFITGLYLVLTTNSLMQRYLYNNHTILQLTIGLIIGVLFGFIMYKIGDKYIMGNIKAKRDDNYLF